MEEKKLFREVEQLIREYMEYTEQELPDIWNDKRIDDKVENKAKEYPNSKEGEILQALDEEKGKETRKKLIEELKQLREEQKQLKQKEVYDKVQAYIEKNKEKLSKELEEKEKALVEKYKEKKNIEKEKRQVSEVKKAVIAQGLKKESKVYVSANEELKEVLKKYRKVNKEIDLAKEAVKQSKEKLTQIDEKYNVIDFTSENGIYGLLALIGREQEKENVRISDGILYDGNEKIENMNLGEIKDKYVKQVKPQAQTKEMGQEKIEKVIPDVIIEAKAGQDAVKPINLIEKAQTKQEQLEQEELIRQQKVAQKSKDIKITYDSKENKYVMNNIGMGIKSTLSRSKIKDITIEQIASGLEIDKSQLYYVDPQIYMVLGLYDERYKTNKAEEYIKELTNLTKNREDRIKSMKEIGININYDLRDIYKNEKSEVDAILKQANLVNKIGIGTVKKGPKVAIREFFTNVFKNVLPKENKVKQLVSGKKEEISESIKSKTNQFTSSLHTKVDEKKAWISAKSKGKHAKQKDDKGKEPTE